MNSASNRLYGTQKDQHWRMRQATVSTTYILTENLIVADLYVLPILALHCVAGGCTVDFQDLRHLAIQLLAVQALGNHAGTTLEKAVPPKQSDCHRRVSKEHHVAALVVVITEDLAHKAKVCCILELDNLHAASLREVVAAQEQQLLVLKFDLVTSLNAVPACNRARPPIVVG